MERNFIEAISDGLKEEMACDSCVVILGEDVGRLGGVFHVTDRLISEFGSERVIDTPLAESAIVGAAIGMSLNGLRPVAEIMFSDFIHSAWDQLLSEAAKMRYRSNNGWRCPMVVRVPYGAGVHGGLYHSQSIETILCHTAGLKVVVPSTPIDAKGLLKSAIRDEDPVVFLEHKKLYRLVSDDIPDDDYTIPIGEAAVRRQGSDLTVVSYGMMAHLAVGAAERLAGEGIDAEVIDLRSLVPLDSDTMLSSVRKTGKVMVVHEDNLTLGMGAELAAIIAGEAFEYLDAPIIRLASPDVPAMPYAPTLEEFCLPNEDKIADAMRKLAFY